jgi:hypothetical protein
VYRGKSTGWTTKVSIPSRGKYLLPCEWRKSKMSQFEQPANIKFCQKLLTNCVTSIGRSSCHINKLSRTPVNTVLNTDETSALVGTINCHHHTVLPSASTASTLAPMLVQPRIRGEPWVPSSGMNRPWHDAPSSAEVRNTCSYKSTSLYVFKACCLIKHMDFIVILVRCHI